MKQSHDNRCPTGAFRLVKLRQRDPTTKLGFSLRGGKEATGSSVGVFVSHIEPMGQASQIGLRLGDQLIQVNGLQVSQATYDEVIELIKQTPKCDHICLLVNYVGRIPYQERAGDPIGWLNVNDNDHNDQNTPTSQLDDYSPTGQRDISANYSIGQTNHQPLEDSLGNMTNLASGDGSQEQDVASASLSPGRLDHETELAGGGYQVGVAEARNLNSSTSNQDKSYSSSSSAVSSCFLSQRECDEYDDDDDDDGEGEDVVLTKVLTGSSSSSASTSSGCSISMSSVQSGHSSASSQTSETLTKVTTKNNMNQAQEEIQTPVRVPGGRRTNEPFGCGVVKGPDEWPGIFVQNVKRNSLAERVGLQPGDQLLEAEGHQLTEMAFDEAINLIKRLQLQQDELLLLVRKGAALKHLAKCKQHSNGAGQIRALNQDGVQQENNQERDLRRVAPLPPTTADNGNKSSESQPAVKCNRPPLRPTVRTKPLEAPPAPPTRRIPVTGESRPLVALAAPNQLGSDKLEHSKRLVNGQSDVASSAPIANSAGGGVDDEGAGCSRLANSISVRATEANKDKRQQVAEWAQQPAAENKSQRKSETTTKTTTISSEPMTRRPADRVASKRRLAKAEEAAKAQVAAEELSSPQRIAPAPVERADELKAPKAIVHLERHNSNSPPAGSSLAKGCDNDEPKAASAGREHQMAPKSASQMEAPSLDLDSEFELDANQRASQLAGCNHNSHLHQHQHQHQQVDEKHKEAEGQRVPKTNGMGQNYHHCDDELELERNRCEHEEEIRIVKQNCKLHHNSAQNLVRSKMFLQQPVDNDCKHFNRFASSNQRGLSPQTDLTRPLAPPPPSSSSVKLSANRAPKGFTSSSNQLQRHVSVDNLNLMNMYVANGALNYPMRRGIDEPICSNQLTNLRHHHQELLFPRQSRPNSVLGQTKTTAPSSRVGSPLVCCPALNQKQKHYRRAASQLRRNQNENELLLRQSQSSSHQADSSQECCLMATACQKQHLLLAATYQRAPIGQLPPIRPTTMKHLRAVSTSKSATGASGGRLFKQPSCNTLALAKFKARSEDRLNLMYINLNYVQINPTANGQQQQQQPPTMASGDLHLLRLQQARHQKQQARILNSARQMDWPNNRRPINATDLVAPTCCLKQAQLTNLIKQTQTSTNLAALHQPVFNYATATGMISQTRKVSPLARSCCAIDWFQVDQLNERSDQTLAMAKQTQKQQRKIKLPTPMAPAASIATTCYAHACCCSSCPREQRQNLQATEPAKLANGAGGGGASTDSSGYQSSSEMAARRQSDFTNSADHHLKRSTKTGGASRPTRSSPEFNRSNQTRRLSTFGSAAATQSRPTAGVPACAKGEPQSAMLSQSPVIEIGSCGVSSISSATVASSISSLSPFSCSPLSSPGQRYPSSSSSSSSHVDLTGGGGGTRTSEPMTTPTKNKTRLFKRHGNEAQLAGAGPDQNAKSIPRPPPMPLDDLTLRPARKRPEMTESEKVRSCQQAQFGSKPTATSGSGAISKVPTKSGNSEQLVNKLCFVDELKMLANQQQKGKHNAHLDQSSNQRQGDSATLIKLINANKVAASSSGARRGPIECNCCQASDCSLDQQPAVGVPICRKLGCGSSKAAGRNAKTACNESQPSKSVQLRDEEDNKRRQHELLMEEFKTAHSKMFNRLRKVNGNNEGRKITNGQQHGDDGDEEPLAGRTGQHNEHPTGTKSSAATNKISNNGANLAVIRPRPTIATN